MHYRTAADSVRITASNISKLFKQNTPTELKVLGKLDFSVAPGEFVVFFGPNGCGKTTLLSLLGGLDSPTQGVICIEDAKKQVLRPGFIFQNAGEALFPWRTAVENVEFALECKGIEKERKRTAFRILQRVGLGAFAESFPYELSGGMKQLVQIARAIAFDPDYFLLDEPFSALDYSVRREMEETLQRIWMENRKTTAMVCHDVEEAVFLADRIIVLSKRPAQVKGIVRVQLPRPRTTAMISSVEFLSARSETLKAFEAGLT